MQEEAIFYHEEINESHAENSSPETTHSPHYCLKVVIINVMKMMMRRINDQGIVIHRHSACTIAHANHEDEDGDAGGVRHC